MSNTTTTSATASVIPASAVSPDALVALADRAEYMTAEAYHVIWEFAKANLGREDQALVWSELKARSIERKLGHFAGKRYLAKHPDEKASAPAWAKPKADAPAKQEKPKAKVAPAKQEKADAPAKAAPKAKEPTQKQMLANMLLSMDRMEKALASVDKRLTAIEKKLAK